MNNRVIRQGIGCLLLISIFWTGDSGVAAIETENIQVEDETQFFEIEDIQAEDETQLFETEDIQAEKETQILETESVQAENNESLILTLNKTLTFISDGTEQLLEYTPQDDGRYFLEISGENEDNSIESADILLPENMDTYFDGNTLFADLKAGIKYTFVIMSSEGQFDAILKKTKTIDYIELIHEPYKTEYMLNDPNLVLDYAGLKYRIYYTDHTQEIMNFRSERTSKGVLIQRKTNLENALGTYTCEIWIDQHHIEFLIHVLSEDDYLNLFEIAEFSESYEYVLEDGESIQLVLKPTLDGDYQCFHDKIYGDGYSESLARVGYGTQENWSLIAGETYIFILQAIGQGASGTLMFEQCRNVVELNVIQMPSIVNYLVGDSFFYGDDMKIEITYDDGEKEIVNYDFPASDGRKIQWNKENVNTSVPGSYITTVELDGVFDELEIHVLDENAYLTKYPLLELNQTYDFFVNANESISYLIKPETDGLYDVEGDRISDTWYSYSLKAPGQGPTYDWNLNNGEIYMYTIHAGPSSLKGNVKLIKYPDSSDFLFKDVNHDQWFYQAVKWVYENRLIMGTSDDTFSPNDTMIRGQLLTILYNLEDCPSVNESIRFPDVNDDKYYTNAIRWASSNNIVSGYSNGMFGPEDSITREQAAKIFYLYAKYKGYDVSVSGSLSDFSDVSKISNYAKKYMKWAVGEGLFKGSNGKLNPKGTATRAEISAVLKRFLENTNDI